MTAEGERPELELAGNKMRLETHADGSATITFDDKGTGRGCGYCTLCCKLLPVMDLHKAAGERCRFWHGPQAVSVAATRVSPMAATPETNCGSPLSETAIAARWLRSGILWKAKSVPDATEKSFRHALQRQRSRPEARCA